MWPHTTTTLPSISRLPHTPRNASGRSTARQHWRNPDLSTSQDPDMMRMAYERTAYTFFDGMKGEFVKETEALKDQYEAHNAMQIMTLQDQILTLKRQIVEMHGHATRTSRDVATDEIQTISPASSTQLSRLHDQRVALKEGAQTQPAGLQDQIVPLKRQANDQGEASVAQIQDGMLDLRRQVRALQEGHPDKQGQATGLQDELKKACASEVRKALESFLGGQQLRQHVKRILDSEVQASLERKIGDVAGRVDAQSQSIADLMERVSALESQAPQHRVGTANAQSWLARAREQLDEFGRSLKDSDTKAGNPTAEALLESMAQARAELDITNVVCHSPVEEVPPWGQRPQGPDRPPLPDNMTPDFGECGGGGRRGNGRRKRADIFDEGLSSGEEVVESLHQAHTQGQQFGQPEDGLRAQARGLLEAIMLDEEEQNDGQEEEELRAKARDFLEAWMCDGDEPGDGVPEEEELRANARGLLEALLLDGDEDGGGLDDHGLAARAREHLEDLLLDNDGGN
mmetsp:Transcript_110952/g.313978  ORF Transcript_110952/g.313978 Transcript_110952/m.313978 type:complete len:516 (+) Transcript_110952:97-1644(+)